MGVCGSASTATWAWTGRERDVLGKSNNQLNSQRGKSINLHVTRPRLVVGLLGGAFRIGWGTRPVSGGMNRTLRVYSPRWPWSAGHLHLLNGKRL